MTNYEIQRRIRRIRRLDGDPEAQHEIEDELWADVLRAVADVDYEVPWQDGDSEQYALEVELQHIRDLCRAALGTKDIEFPRWCG